MSCGCCGTAPARVFVAGLSMGGALALRLAALHGDAVSGVMVVNPANKVHGVAAHALPVLRHLVPATKGIASDIAKPVTRELGYDRVPLHAAHSLRNFFRLVDRELPQVTQPLLLMRSPQDHVVPPPTRRGSSPGCRRRTSRRSCWNRATTWRRWTMTRS